MEDKNTKKDLETIQKLLCEEMLSHPALEGTDFKAPEPLLSETFLSLLSYRNYDSQVAITTGLSLELLGLAVAKHYLPVLSFSEEKKSIPENIDIITGDFFYSKALITVSKLKDSQVIKILATAIASIAEGMSKPLTEKDIYEEKYTEIFNFIEKTSALYKAAGEIASYLGVADEEISEAITKIAVGIGGVRQSKNLLAEEKHKTILKNSLEHFMEKIESGRSFLIGLGYDIDIKKLLKH